MQTIKIGNKEYVAVNERLKAFRSAPEYKGFALVTKVHELTPDACTMEAQIFDKDGRLVANGFARELRSDPFSKVNKTSHVENCETSAWGRALGNMGIGIDESICSAQELAYAIAAEKQQQAQAKPAAAQTAQPAQKAAAHEAPEKPQLTQSEQDELDAAMAQMDFAISKDELNQIYARYKDATFAAKLLEHGMAICKQNGWEAKSNGKEK